MHVVKCFKAAVILGSPALIDVAVSVLTNCVSTRVS